MTIKARRLKECEMPGRTELYEVANSREIVTEEKQRSEKDKLLRNKYMGVWRWESSRMRMMMMRFPRTVVRYMARNRAKYMPCSSARMGSPRRMNSDTVLSLSLLIFLIFCCELKSKWGKNKI